MKKIAYSQDYKKKISILRNWLDLRFGKDTRTKHMTEIKKRLTFLKEFSDQGMSVRDMFGVDSDYEFLYVSHNYIFYYQAADTIYIVNIYDEREDFMYKLFGIRTTSEETEQFGRE